MKSLSAANFVAPYKFIGLHALSVDKPIIFLIFLDLQACIKFDDPIIFVFTHSSGFVSAVGTIFVAAA